MKSKTLFLFFLITLLIGINSCSKDDDSQDDPNDNSTPEAFTDPRDGQTYETVEIGNQVWFAENLNYETENSWWYDNDPDNGETYGRLYTWHDALDACPDGWHLPTDEEWKTLEMELGMSRNETDTVDYRGTDQGKQMKATSGWLSDGNGTNSSGFNALAGGGFYHTNFQGLGLSAWWWSFTENEHSTAWGRGLLSYYETMGRGYGYKTAGHSIRCLKD